jgi:putative sterol carrier protein
LALAVGLKEEAKRLLNERMSMAQRPSTTRELFMAMPQFANQDAIEGVNKIVQFDVTGDDPGQYYLTVYEGQVIVNEGVAENPDVTVTTPADVWMNIATGQENGAVAFMTGKFKATGNLSVLMSMQSWFNMPG